MTPHAFGFQKVLRGPHWKNSPLRLRPSLSFASCVAGGIICELWYVEDVGEPLRQLRCGRFTRVEGGGVECFLCDADARKKFHQSIFTAGLDVCLVLLQLRFGKPVSFVY